MNSLPSFLGSTLISLQEMIEEWGMISSLITNEQLEVLEHGCELVKETYEEVETSRNTGNSTILRIENGRVYDLRGQRMCYDGSTARNDQKRKRRRTAERQSSNENAAFTPRTQDSNDTPGSAESIEHARSPGQEGVQVNSPVVYGRLSVQTTMLSPATSAVLDQPEVEQETLFVPEDGEIYHDRHDDQDAETANRVEVPPDQGTRLPRTPGEVSHQSKDVVDDDLQSTTYPYSNDILESLSDGAQDSQSVPHDDPFSSNEVPDLFQQAFDDFIEDALSHPFSNDVFGLYHHNSPIQSEEEQNLNRLVARFQDLIDHRRFWLPHENRRHPSVIATPDQILRPLMNKEPIPSDVLHGILYRILPDSFDIVEHETQLDFHEDIGRLTSSDCDNTVVIISSKRPKLVLVNTCGRKLTYVTSQEMLNMATSVTLPADWVVQTYDPTAVDPSIESTLLSIHVAEAECKSMPITMPCSEQLLRWKYFETLLIREEQRLEAPQDDASIQADDFPSRPAEAIAKASPSLKASAEFHVDGFDPLLLKKALSRRPKNLKDARCLRILQYVHATGSPEVLDQLKLAGLPAGQQLDLVAHGSREAHAARIAVIHAALESRGSTSHFGIVQSRFARLCYYREFQRAVESLRSSNKARRVERQKLARHQQRLGHVAEDEQLILTPRTTAMAQQYSETTGRSSSVVRDDVVRRLSATYKRHSPDDQTEIKSQVDSYIWQGKIMHLILQGCSHDASPAILLLIPTVAATPLDVSTCVEDDRARLKLRKRFKPNEIDELSEAEAQWMGETLSILRPEILNEPPDDALKLIEMGPAEIHDLSCRDSKDFIKDPFGLFRQINQADGI